MGCGSSVQTAEPLYFRSAMALPSARPQGLVLCTSDQEPPSHFTRSVFLMGADGAAWGAKAVKTLQALGFNDGVIFMGASEITDLPLCVDWAEQARLMSDVILCFVPDNLSPAAASQFAVPVLQWASSGKLVCGGFGLPQRLLAEVVIQDTVEDALQATWEMVAQGALRTAAERNVPLMIWQTPSWSGWYNNLVMAGNRLDGAKIEWSFRVGPNKAFVLFWSVHADIYVAAEDRNKSNEVVVSRPDIACVLAYLPGREMLDTEIILIKEFRSPCCNAEMFVHELPGGSSFMPKSDFFQTAADELYEETGIKVAKDRLSRELSRQAVATVSTHQVHLFSCRLTQEEMEMARRNAKDRTTFGNASDTEITYIVTMPLGEALESNALDFVTLGMVMQTIGILYGYADEAGGPKSIAHFGGSQKTQDVKKSHSEINTVAALASHWKATQHAMYARIGASAVNHEAKRAISNTMTWMDEIERLVEETRKQELPVSDLFDAIKTTIAQVRDDNQDAFQGCKNVIMMTGIAAGTYRCVSEPFAFLEYIKQRIGCRNNIRLAITGDVPSQTMIDKNLFVSLIRNLVNNAEGHGQAGGTISILVKMLNNVICIVIEHMGGKNHAKCLKLQASKGHNFLEEKHQETFAPTEHIGNANSTFLGMREIADSTALLGGKVEVIFHEEKVVTTLKLCHTAVVAPLKLVQDTVHGEKEVEPFPTGIRFICCDDDKAPRALAKGLLKKLQSAGDSLILGEGLAEVALVPQMVSDSLPMLGSMGMVCIFDQNMHWPEGSVLGTQLCTELRERKFAGLLIIRSANDDESHFQGYLDAGADAVLSKGMKPKDVAGEVHRLYCAKKMGSEIGFDLKTKMSNAGLVSNVGDQFI